MRAGGLLGAVLVANPWGWRWLNLGSLAPVLLMGAGLLWLAARERSRPASA